MPMKKLQLCLHESDGMAVPISRLQLYSQGSYVIVPQMELESSITVLYESVVRDDRERTMTVVAK